MGDIWIQSSHIGCWCQSSFLLKLINFHNICQGFFNKRNAYCFFFKVRIFSEHWHSHKQVVYPLLCVFQVPLTIQIMYITKWDQWKSKRMSLMIVLAWLPANHGHPVNQARPKLDQSLLKGRVGCSWAKAWSRLGRAVASTSQTGRAQTQTWWW